MNDYAAATSYLLELKSRGVALGLERMEHFVEALGHPERAIPCIHVAGTNGKGSVAAMLEAILRASGWRTGLYTSPHLVRLGERVQVNRVPLSPEEIVTGVRALQPVAAELAARRGDAAHPSYFEFMTALAFWHFQHAGCDVAVIEVGMGGRRDATNVVQPEISVITSIGLDHCEVLGHDLATIAREKAGIIKPGRPVVLGRLPPEAEQVIRGVANVQGARVISVREEFGDELVRYPHTNLAGDYQRWNAATATLVARALPPRWHIREAGIEGALQQVAWPGRWQRVSAAERSVILDTSHNREGAVVLDANLAQLAETTGRPPIIMAGVLGLERARALVPVFCRYAREVYFAVPAQSRACDFDQLESFVPGPYAGRVRRTSVPAAFPLGACALGEPGDVVVVTGSIYLVGEVLSRLDPALGASESHLQDF